MSITYRLRHVTPSILKLVRTKPAALAPVCVIGQSDESSPLLAQLRQQAVTDLRTLGGDPADLGPVLNIGKTWHALRLLLGEAAAWLSSEAKMGAAVQCGDDTANVFAPSEVAQAAAVLREISVAHLESRFDGERLDRLEAYHGPWSEPGRFQEIASAFTSLQGYFDEAEKLGRVLVVYWA